MPISQTQLETWSHQGAVQTAKATHEAIRRALSSGRVDDSGHSSDVYLQGSYKNTTNIRGNSDVDVVVELTDVHTNNTDRLSEQEQELFQQNFSAATYGWDKFRADVLADLRRYFTVTEGNKSLKVAGGSGRLPADVVVCLKHHSYDRYRSDWNADYHRGIAFWTRTNRRRIVNYPKQHYDRGVEKNAKTRTAGNFKPVVRILKNARTYLIGRTITADLAPSYFVECWLNNVPDRLFVGRYADSFPAVLNYLKGADYTGWMCGNGIQFLFGPHDIQWDETSARTLCRRLIELWNNS